MNWRRRTQVYQDVLWEPFATSTPLKTGPNQRLKDTTAMGLIEKLVNVHKIQSVPKSQQTETRDFTSKKFKRSRLHTFYDVNSSSDEESNESKRPIIKISSRKNTRSLIKSKKVKDEETGNKVETVDNTKNRQVTVNVMEKTSSDEVDLNNENCQTEDCKNKEENGEVELHSHLENCCVSSDDGGKIFDTTNSIKNLVNDHESNSNVPHKEIAKITKKIRQQRNVAKIKTTEVKEITKISKNSQLENDTVNNPKKLCKNNKVSKTLQSKVLSTANRRGKKLSSKKLIHELSIQQVTAAKPMTPLHSWENKINLSHQLFSDSREQECINTLDLTSEEIPAERTTYNLWQKPKKVTYKKPTLSHPSIKNDDDKKEDESKKPRKRKQKPEEFGPQENINSCRENQYKKNSGILKNEEKSVKKLNEDIATRNTEETEEMTKNLGICNKKVDSVTELNKGSEVKNIEENNVENIRLTENNDETHEEEENKHRRPRRKSHKPKEFWLPESVHSNKENLHKKNSIISTKNEKSVTKLKKTTALKNIEKMEENKGTNVKMTENVLNATKTKKKGEKKTVDPQQNSASPIDNAVTSNYEEIKGAQTDSVESGEDVDKNVDEVIRDSEDKTLKGKAISDNKPVFSLLSQLPFNSNTLGCAVAECWNKKNFKCGVFKLKVNSQLTHKTSCHNSHLGGVVVKGNLKMEIGDRELELKEGDMAFVPPLTQWKATNICEYEAVFYYWCGRFND